MASQSAFLGVQRTPGARHSSAICPRRAGTGDFPALKGLNAILSEKDSGKIRNLQVGAAACVRCKSGIIGTWRGASS